MDTKHSNRLRHLISLIYRKRLRKRLRDIVHWEHLTSSEAGCTAIIGVCSKLPQVLAPNLRCLRSARWPSLKEVIAVVDGTESALPPHLESRLRNDYRDLNLRFLYYSAQQALIAEKINLPYVYSWLSWCIGIKHVRTEHILIHDYDALVLDDALHKRYTELINSSAKVQGISWYHGNGVAESDCLVTTFEAFFDAGWLRAFEPIYLFNELRIKGKRSIDYDTTLAVQDRFLSREERTVVPMSADELVHPSQMIHQYTMFRRHRLAPLPCFSIPMLPFFSYLNGTKGSIEYTTEVLGNDARSNINFLGDGLRFNLSRLTIEQIDWALKQMVQVMVVLKLPPDALIYRYGKALYRSIGASEHLIWRGDFTDLQRAWIQCSNC